MHTENGPDLASEKIQLPATIARNERRVRLSFWRKLARVGARIPFSQEAASAYFCAIDRKTPTRVRATLLAALAYFVIPADMIPDFVAVVGFTDDATVLLTALSLVQAHIKPHHQQQARDALGLSQPEQNT
ncbi:MAG: YkvA family protein [Parvibaculum sp.]